MLLQEIFRNSKAFPLCYHLSMKQTCYFIWKKYIPFSKDALCKQGLVENGPVVLEIYFEIILLCWFDLIWTYFIVYIHKQKVWTQVLTTYKVLTFLSVTVNTFDVTMQCAETNLLRTSLEALDWSSNFHVNFQSIYFYMEYIDFIIK